MTRAFFSHSRLNKSKKPQKDRSTIYVKLYSNWICTDFLTNALIIIIITIIITDNNDVGDDDDDDYLLSACQDALGMESGAISDAQISASTEWNVSTAAIYGRLHLKANGSIPGAWSARTRDVNQWLQIDLIGQDSIVTRVATQGRNGNPNLQWVSKYQLQYSNNTVSFINYTRKELNLTKVK